MRLPRVRFTVRRMMVAVAVVALLLGGASQLKRARERTRLYRQMARSHQASEQAYRSASIAVTDRQASIPMVILQDGTVRRVPRDSQFFGH